MPVPLVGRPPEPSVFERRRVHSYVMLLRAGWSLALVELVGHDPTGQLPELMVASLLSLVLTAMEGSAPTEGSA